MLVETAVNNLYYQRYIYQAASFKFDNKRANILMRLVNFKFEYFSQSILDYIFRRYLSTYYYKPNVCQTNLELYTQWNVSNFKIVHSVKTRKYNFSATTFLKLPETNSTIIQTKLKSSTLLSSLSNLTANREYVLEINVLDMFWELKYVRY